MSIFQYYDSQEAKELLSNILDFAMEHHPAGLSASFLEKDLWVVEILRLLFEEDMLDGAQVAFKGGTALSKCWGAIERFSEDIDLSIHWAHLAESEDETADWQRTTHSRSQIKRFRDRQGKRLEAWSGEFVKRLNERFTDYRIPELTAELVEGSQGEKIHIHYPSVTQNHAGYHLDHILLEFGGRNFGRPTTPIEIQSYVADLPAMGIDFGGLEALLPHAVVNAYDPNFILWEKLTALHQFSTQTKDIKPERLSRHWYDVDAIVRRGVAKPFECSKAPQEVVNMKSKRWAENGVDYHHVLSKSAKFVPDADRLSLIELDYRASISGGLFFSEPASFAEIIRHIKEIEDAVNAHEYPKAQEDPILNV